MSEVYEAFSLGYIGNGGAIALFIGVIVLLKKHGGAIKGRLRSFYQPAAVADFKKKLDKMTAKAGESAPSDPKIDNKSDSTNKGVIVRWIDYFKALSTSKKMLYTVGVIGAIVLGAISFDLLALVAIVLLGIFVKNVASGWKKTTAIVLIVLDIVYLLSNMGSILGKALGLLMVVLVLGVVAWLPLNVILFLGTLCSERVRTRVYSFFQSVPAVKCYFWPTAVLKWVRENARTTA